MVLAAVRRARLIKENAADGFQGNVFHMIIFIYRQRISGGYKGMNMVPEAENPRDFFTPSNFKGS